MKAGEYIGKDGQLYGWKELPEPYCRAGLGYDHCIKNRPNNGPDWTLEPIRYGDVDAAKAALDALVLSEKVELEKREAQASEVLRDACLEFREAASRRGQVCGPCDECKLQPYWGKGVDALVEQEQEEWVTWRSGEFDYRAKPDGSIVEWAVKERCDWTSWDCPDIAIAYRKGREVALEECKEKLLEAAEIADEQEERHEAFQLQARELVEAVLDNETMKGTLQPGPGEYGYALIDQRDWNHIVTVSKTLEAKL